MFRYHHDDYDGGGGGGDDACIIYKNYRRYAIPAGIYWIMIITAVALSYTAVWTR